MRRYKAKVDANETGVSFVCKASMAVAKPFRTVESRALSLAALTRARSPRRSLITWTPPTKSSTCRVLFLSLEFAGASG